MYMYSHRPYNLLDLEQRLVVSLILLEPWKTGSVLNCLATSFSVSGLSQQDVSTYKFVLPVVFKMSVRKEKCDLVK